MFFIRFDKFKTQRQHRNITEWQNRSNENRYNDEMKTIKTAFAPCTFQRNNKIVSSQTEKMKR